MVIGRPLLVEADLQLMAVFVRSGLGAMLTFAGLCDTGADSDLVFRPLAPQLTSKMYIIWKKYQVFSPIAERFVKQLRQAFPA
ncbi:hypothetical protein [Levilactobacillus sp. HBUAS70063]|uniref:hypothetical protein n=1 Tax=Levilactobacillus sp. HBUAS70063 TaxID=3109359 RepID=UPI00313308BA